MNAIQSERTNGITMPLLMGFTNPTQIQVEENFEPIMYDPISQTVFEMRTIGTKCLRTSITRTAKSYSQDKKNEIDDQKNVN